MQSITVALSPSGLNYFATTKLQQDLAKILAGITIPDQTLDLGTIFTFYECDDTVIKLTQGSLSNYAPVIQNGQLVQGTQALSTSGQFGAPMAAPSFNISYQWEETYTAHGCNSIGHGVDCFNTLHDDHFPYNTTASLDVTVTFGFTFDATSNQWSLPVVGTQNAANVNPTVPQGSVIQDGASCLGNRAATALDESFAKINFDMSVAAVMPKVLATIPASGQLTPDILFGFAIGDSGITFPSDQGMALGVTGSVSWKGTAFPGIAPAGLPVPPVPDIHHLQMYLSDYCINGLYWAFYNDGALTTTILPADLPDPNALRVKTYVAACPALNQYKAKAMSALIQPHAAPTVTFQTVYIFTDSVMAVLKTSLPADVYGNLLDNMDGNAYPDSASLEADFAAFGIPQQNFAAIEQAAKLMGGVVTHDLQFKLTILDVPDPAPFIEFSVKRIDALGSFALGATTGENPIQGVQFAFHECSTTAIFIGSNIPGLVTEFPDVWGTVGAENYDQVLKEMGDQGVPLPIMEAFKFVFDQAVLNVEQNFISILSDIEFTG